MFITAAGTTERPATANNLNGEVCFHQQKNEKKDQVNLKCVHFF